MSGLLAVWNDCSPGREAFYEEWYQEEHLIERVGISGFHNGRRYEALRAGRKFLTTYELQGASVIQSEEYRARVGNPTDRTTSIMRNGFERMRRAVCNRIDLTGAIRGAAVVTITYESRLPSPDLKEVSEWARKATAPTHTEIWLPAFPPDGRVSAEESLRGKDATIEGCVTLEFLRESAAIDAAARIESRFRDADVGVYRLLCFLEQPALNGGTG